MLILAIFLPLALTVLTIAVLAKFAVFLSRTGTLSWKHSFFLAGFLFTVTFGAQALLRILTISGAGVPIWIRTAGGTLVAFAFIAWFLAHHVMSPDRISVGMASGTKSAAVVAGLMLLFALPILLLGPVN